MSNPIPEVRRVTAMMDLRLAEAQRGAETRWLLHQSRHQSQQVLPYEGARWLRSSSLELILLGARLVAYGLSSYAPAT